MVVWQTPGGRAADCSSVSKPVPFQPGICQSTIVKEHQYAVHILSPTVKKITLTVLCEYLGCRWAEVSGFDGIVPDPSIFKEVIMLCCAIKPLCAWNCQVGLRQALLLTAIATQFVLQLGPTASS